MSNLAIRTPSAIDFTKEQLELIKATVAKGASDPELKLFLYRCKNMGLDPLRPGQVHFVKYGSNPGSIVIGIEGLRSLAARTGKLEGVKRGVLRNEEGKCVGAWCEVYRSDWKHPAREEVSFSEYNTGKNLWAKMPETMIKKVAEVAALRMAFPDDLDGLYSEEEMHQAAARDARPREIQAQLDESTEAPAFEAADYFKGEAETIQPEGPGEYLIKVGKNKGKKIKELSAKDIENFINFYNDKESKGERMHPDVIEYYEMAIAFTAEASQDVP
jgi:phage recombination protein Bet